MAKDLQLQPADMDVFLGGYMASAFFLVGAPSSLLLGAWADQRNRRHLLLVLGAAAVVATAGSAASTSITSLLLWRSVLGLALGGVNPVVYSMFGDMYGPAERSAVAGVAGIALGGGTAIGQILSSTLTWRAAFGLSSAYTVLALLATYALVPEPARGTVASAAATANSNGGNGASDSRITSPRPADAHLLSWRSLSRQLRRVLAVRTNRYLLLQSVFGTLPWACVNTFLPDFLSREKGMTKGAATGLVAIFGAGAAVGGIAGGMLGRALYKRYGPQAVPLMCAPIQAAAALPMIALLYSPHADALAADRTAAVLVNAGALLGGVLSSVTGPNLRSMYLNTNLPDQRAQVFSVGYLVDSIAKGIGPYLIGMLVSSGSADRAAVFAVALAGWIVSGAIIGASAGSVAADELAVAEKVRPAKE